MRLCVFRRGRSPFRAGVNGGEDGEQSNESLGIACPTESVPPELLDGLAGGIIGHSKMSLPQLPKIGTGSKGWLI